MYKMYYDRPRYAMLPEVQARVDGWVDMPKICPRWWLSHSVTRDRTVSRAGDISSVIPMPQIGPGPGGYIEYNTSF